MTTSPAASIVPDQLIDITNLGLEIGI